MKAKLLPCPFCGGEPEYSGDVIGCRLANCAGNLALASVEEWDRRTPPAAGQSGWVCVPREPTEAMEAAGWIDKEDVCPCDIYAAMLAAAPPPPAAAEGKEEWLPIESAPRDGTFILVFIFGQDMMVVQWDDRAAPSPDHCWRTLDGLVYNLRAPTHWQRLPPPPKP